MRKLTFLIPILLLVSCSTIQVDADIPPKPRLQRIPDYKWFTPQNEREEKLYNIIRIQNDIIIDTIKWIETTITNNT